MEELQALEDPEEREALFDQYMTEETGDAAALAVFPDGYTFAPGAMLQAFEDASFALEDYGLSPVVETDYGCHVILRLPVDPQGLTMEVSNATGAYLSLSQVMASDLFVTGPGPVAGAGPGGVGPGI